MLVFDCQVDRKAIPRIAVAILDMSFESMPKGIRETDIVQLIASEQRVHARVSTNKIANYVRVCRSKRSRETCSKCA
jgi:hypothetical protein